MAKIVIAGAANCPYYAKAELLGDTLADNLPNFNLHKIVIQQNEWETWLKSTCDKRGWSHNKSPIIWRELVDRGGKGILIGGANDFQEYANGYYGIKSNFISDDMQKIARENLNTKNELDEEERQRQALSKPVHICVTKAAFGVAYNMINEIAQGLALGPETEVSLRLYDSNPFSEVLEGVKLESFDLAHQLLRKVTTTSDLYEAFADCSFIVLLDDIEHGVDEPKADWLKRNHEVFTNYAKVINEVAKKDVKVLVAGNGPSNFNVYMMMQEATTIPSENLIAMSRMTERRAKGLVARRLQVNSACVTNVIVWGNPHATTYIDVRSARVHKYEGAVVGPDWFSLPVPEMIHDDKWLESEFLEQLSERKDAVEGMLGHRAASSQASAVVSMMGHWWNGTPEKQIFSAGVISNGQYGVPEGMVFSFPVTVDNSGRYRIVENTEISDEIKEKIQEIIKELEAEREVIYPTPSPPPPPSPEKEVDIRREGERRSKTPPESSTSPIFGDETKDPGEVVQSENADVPVEGTEREEDIPEGENEEDK